MIPELGHFALILATLVALVLGTLPLIGAHNNRMTWVAVARPAASAMALLITFSFACLTQAFVVSDFSVVYVAQHSNSLLPIQYRVAAVWGGHEGSLLLWMRPVVSFPNSMNSPPVRNTATCGLLVVHTSRTPHDARAPIAATESTEPASTEASWSLSPRSTRRASGGSLAPGARRPALISAASCCATWSESRAPEVTGMNWVVIQETRRLRRG